MIDIDQDQWRVMHALCLKNITRSFGVHMDRRSEGTSRRGEFITTLWSIVGFVFMSLMLAALINVTMYPVGEFIAITCLAFVVFSGVSTQCEGHLFAKKELQVYGTLPINAATHLASKISGSIAHYLLVCSALAAPTFFVLLLEHGLFAGIRWYVSIALCVVFSIFASIWWHLNSLRVALPSKLRFLRSIAGFAYYFSVLTICVVIVRSELEFGEIGSSWNLEGNALFLLLPPYWFLALMLLLDGHFTAITLTGALLAIFGSVPIGLYLFSRINALYLGTLSHTHADSDAKFRLPNVLGLVLSRKIGSLGWERVAVWTLAFSRLKYDSTYRRACLTYLPFVFIVAAISFGRGTSMLSDPFVSAEPEWLLVFTCSYLFMYVCLLFETIRASEHAPASWVLLVAPSNLTRLTTMFVDRSFAVFVLPFLVLIFVAYCFFWESPINAFLHTFTLGWLSYAAINLKSIVIPVLPFAPSSSSPASSPRFCLNFLLAFTGGVVVFHSLAPWMYASYWSYGGSILLGMVICLAVRILAGMRYDRKFQNADLIT